MSRNVFDGNRSAEVSVEEALKLGEKLHTVLPELAEGYRYELVKLTNGRTVVVVERN